MTIKTLLKVSLVLTFCVILMGAYTRLSDAGLGCPDWPGCYGMLKVPSQSHELSAAQAAFPERPIEIDKAWLEMIHRYIAGSLGLLILLILVKSLRQTGAPKRLPIIIAMLVIFQAALGMWTVTLKLMPIIVMLHLLGGFALFSLLLLLYLQHKPLRIPNGDAPARKMILLAFIGFVVLLLQIMLGGWTSSNYAALACTSLPICEGNWFDKLAFIRAFSPFQGEHDSFEFGVLDYNSRMTIHIAHRVGAIITAATLLYLAFRLATQARSTMLRQSGWVLAILVLLQIGLGISNVVLHLPLSVAVAHNAGAALLMLMLVYINYALWRKT